MFNERTCCNSHTQKIFTFYFIVFVWRMVCIVHCVFMFTCAGWSVIALIPVVLQLLLRSAIVQLLCLALVFFKRNKMLCLWIAVDPKQRVRLLFIYLFSFLPPFTFPHLLLLPLHRLLIAVVVIFSIHPRPFLFFSVPNWLLNSQNECNNKS